MITYENKVALNENSQIAEINKVTADNMNEIKSVINGLANLFFPIGKVEIFFDSNDHSNHLGFSWERTSIGKMPIGYDSTDDNFKTIGAIGGEKTHTLTVDEMPSHTHNLNAFTSGSGSTGRYTGEYTWSSTSSDTESTKWIGSTTSTGSGVSHNNMPPYQVFSFWKRVS